MHYCGKHSLDHESLFCPRCAAEERHEELIDQARDGREATVRAMHESDYRRANPGDYECPHCKYISLKWGASRCPLCHGELRSEHWSNVRAAEKAAAERERAREEAYAAEKIRTAPARAAAARAAAREASAKRFREGLVQGLPMVPLGAVGGFIVGFFRGCNVVGGTEDWGLVWVTVVIGSFITYAVGVFWWWM